VNLPDVTIDAYGDGDWLIRAKHTGFIQIPKAIIDGLVHPLTVEPPKNKGEFQPKPGGWPLTVETVYGPRTTVYKTRREYREAKRGL